MARGRMINNAIVEDLAIFQLSDDTSRLAFTWLVTFADCEGRVTGDPMLLVSKLFPRRRDIGDTQMEKYVQEWADNKLITWYEVKGCMWIEFPGFSKNQHGLRRDREPGSTIPAPREGRIIAGYVPEECRTNDGVMPEDIPPKRREIKIKEEKCSAASFPPVVTDDNYISCGIREFENTIGLLSGGTQAEEVKAYLNELHEKGIDDWWYTCLQIGADANKRRWDYIRGILRNHLNDGTAPVRNKNDTVASNRAKLKTETVAVVDSDGRIVDMELKF